jgi:hypothetical protein
VAAQDPPKPGDGDEHWTTYSPPVSQPIAETPARPETPETLPPTHVPYGTKQSYSGTYPPAPGTTVDTVLSSDLVGSKTKGCGVIGLVIALVGFLVVSFGVVAAIKAVSGGWDELKDGMGDPFSALEKPDMHSTEGWNDLVDALGEEMGGGTTVFDVVLYPEYAVVDVPADKTSKRSYSYYFDGDLRRTSQGTTDDTRFDLSTIDPTVLVRLFKKAKTDLVEDPTTVYAIISQPGEFDNGAWFSIYATNAFSETGYFTADKSGKILQTIVTP